MTQGDIDGWQISVIPAFDFDTKQHKGIATSDELLSIVVVMSRCFDQRYTCTGLYGSYQRRQMS
jgi:hypothetical protein